ncbi:MAG: transcriptional coactivator p15/PC4 family protein [bacterium]
MANRIVHCFQKNATEQVWVSMSEYKGKDYIDLRVYFQDGDGEYKPTKKGLAISPHLLPELEAAIMKLKEMIKDRQ